MGDHFKEDGDWIWTSFCSVEKYLLGIVADGRGKEVCERLVNAKLDKLAHMCMPVFVTDGYRPYRTALLERYSTRVYNTGRGRRGYHLEPYSNFDYGIVEKRVWVRNWRRCAGMSPTATYRNTFSTHQLSRDTI